MYERLKSVLRPVVFGFKKKYERLMTGPGGSKEEFRFNKNIKWIRNSYGGFFLDTSLLSRESIVLSFGVGTDISFDEGVAYMGVKQIFLFDPTPRAKIFIEEKK